ncbi:beta-phosphoglucomutase [Nitrospirillum sp. BR 11164]|uniref:beta-phosphoglucomutase n=1 Tax=Nitrospirillum sp. BR 11164 TaxID=3104324 RepID=UPI002AFE6C6F|nr:beta-phosphoglucomutase [Nitrospirillum sp. BR 11164]MEA1647609.1 beta-phosphoglucomutase [Nitrospirillum sp. BR 11164]
MPRFDAVLFDLDGVLADTAHIHFAAWRRLGEELGIHLEPAFEEKLKGVDRMGSLELILAQGGPQGSVTRTAEEKRVLADRKNGYYTAAIAEQTPDDLLPGARRVLEEVRAAGLKIALASASRNAPPLLRQLGIAPLIDAIADPAAVKAPKPAPDLFLEAARLVGAAPDRCLGIEDSVAGIISIKDAGMVAVGIGDPTVLTRADYVVPTTEQFHIADFL